MRKLPEETDMVIATIKSLTRLENKQKIDF